MATKNLRDFHAHNTVFQKGFNEGGIGLFVGKRHCFVLTCMDPRVPIEAALGIKNGDCGVLRNAGGRVTDDVLRSFAIAKANSGVNEIYVVHHTDCGMMHAPNDAAVQSAVEGKFGAEAGAACSKFEWLTFQDLDRSVVDDMKKLQESPLVPDDVILQGLIYDVDTGAIRSVEGGRTV